MAHLLDKESLETLALEGLPPECLPTDEFRPVVSWALDYYHSNGQRLAPSELAMREEYGDLLDDFEVVLGDPEDSMEWAIADLKASFAHLQGQQFNKAMARDLVEASSNEVVGVVAQYSGDLVELSLRLQPADQQVEVSTGLGDRLYAYRSEEQLQGIQGATFGFDEIDSHTRGLYPGELLILAAGPKQGKSLLLLWMALQEYKRGKSVCLFTLENSPVMTLDRMACMGARVSSRGWQRRDLSSEALDEAEGWIREAKADERFFVLQPEPGRRSVEQMVREAQVRGAEALYIDQLTFVDLPESRRPKTERIGEALHWLKAMISTGRNRMPCVLAHQINRDGVRAAAKEGRHEMYHMSESSEVERTADWVCSLFRSTDSFISNGALLQILAARREEIKNWELFWDVDGGSLGVAREVKF
jgi:replicative DNA helicase